MDAARTAQRRSSVAVTVRPEWDEDVSWQDRALCRGADANLFFTPTYVEKKEDREVREAQAKAVCARCPVRHECLAFALRTREPYGIWGGLTELERKAKQHGRAS